MTTNVLLQTLITSSSRKPSREVGMLRNTREDQRDSDELHNDSINLAIASAILRTERLELWERRTIATNAFTLLFGKS